MTLTGALVAATLVLQSATNPLNPYDGQAWLALAREARDKGSHQQVLQALQRAMDLGALAPADGWVEIAAAEAAAGQPAAAVVSLQKALAAGYRFRDRLASDKRFAGLPAADLAALSGRATRVEPASPEAWRADLDFLATELARVHPLFRGARPPAAFRTALDELSARAGGASDAATVVAIQRVLATLGDGHTLVWPFGMQRGTLHRVPLTLYWFDEGLFVTDAADPALIGAEVVSLGGVPSRDVLERLTPWLSIDNPMQARWAAPLYVTFPEFLVAAGVPSPSARRWQLRIAGQAVEREFELVTVDPAKLETKLPATRRVAPARYLSRLGDTAWFEQVSEGVVYAQVNAMANPAGDTLERFAERLHAALVPGKGRALVLDLRHNSGGEASLADGLLRTLLAFEAAGGRTAVIVGRSTFSAAQTFVTRLDAWTSAVFVGEPTGSKPNHYGNETPFRLPHTGLRGTISSGWNQPVTSRDHRIWIAPEVLVPIRAADYFAGSDPALERALAQFSPQR